MTPSQVFVATDGVVAIEAEAVTPTNENQNNQWIYETKHADYIGGGYYRWNSASAIRGPGAGVLTYQVNLQEPGEYYLSLRALRHREGRPVEEVEWDQENDFWVRINGGEWVKMIFHGPFGVWRWATTLSFGHGPDLKEPATYELDSGINTIEISGRSANAMIDRVHFSKDRFNRDLDTPLSPIEGVTPIENIAPTLTEPEAGNLIYVENDGAVKISPEGLNIIDADDKIIASAIVQITDNYQEGEDILSMGAPLPDGIKVSFNANNGRLTISGETTLQQYTTLLRSVTYENLSATPSTADRRIRFTVNDGEDNSNTVQRVISVTDVEEPSSEYSAAAGFFSLPQLEALSASIDTPINDFPSVQKGSLRLETVFDETYYLQTNQDVANAVTNGFFESGFHHFYEFGWLEGRNPSILFDEAAYLTQYADIEQAVADNLFSSGFQHFALYGNSEGRDPNELFSQQDYLVANPDIKDEITNGGGSFNHWITQGMAEGRGPRVTLFDEAFYLEQNTDVAAAVKAEFFQNGYHHYLTFGAREGRDPSALFDESAYLEQHSDVAAAVKANSLASGFSHYVLYGRAEGRETFAVA